MRNTDLADNTLNQYFLRAMVALWNDLEREDIVWVI
jgi:hypothetical protein